MAIKYVVSRQHFWSKIAKTRCLKLSPDNFFAIFASSRCEVEKVVCFPPLWSVYGHSSLLCVLGILARANMQISVYLYAIYSAYEKTTLHVDQISYALIWSLTIIEIKWHVRGTFARAGICQYANFILCTWFNIKNSRLRPNFKGPPWSAFFAPSLQIMWRFLANFNFSH